LFAIFEFVVTLDILEAVFESTEILITIWVTFDGFFPVRYIIFPASNKQGAVSVAHLSLTVSFVINEVATDDIINAAEVGGVITGTNFSGFRVGVIFGSNGLGNQDIGSEATVAGTSWSYTLVAADIIAMGEGAFRTIFVKQFVGEGLYQDAVGSSVISAKTSRNITVDTTAPTATIMMSDDELANGETSTVTITFSEAVTNFANDDVTVENGTLDSLTKADDGITWVGTFTPNFSFDDQITNVVSLADTYTDLAGNVGTVATSPNYKVLAPVLMEAITLSDSALKIGENSTVSIPFFGTATMSATPVVDSLAWNLTYTDGTPDEVQACFLASAQTLSFVATAHFLFILPLPF